MKFSAILAFAAAELLQLVTAADPIVVIDDCSAFCDVGMFCTNSVPECHNPPAAGYCFNETISEYQLGCNEGYECSDNLCQCFIDEMPLATTPTPTTQAPTTTPAPVVIVWTSTPTVTPTPTSTPTTTSYTVSTSEGIYTSCPSGTYWEIGASACRGPSYAGECYNPATALYQDGCASGFTCINHKCSTTPPATFSPAVCYVRCDQSDEYCENGATTCRGPEYAGECFNPATGLYQNGCGAGYVCANNLCVRS
ncbi:hypothetical protein PRIC1_004520 [Phytophthora ramorum]